MSLSSTTVVVVEGGGDSEGIVASAVVLAEKAATGLKILTVPVRIPLAAGCQGWGLCLPWSITSLRAEAIAAAANSCTRSRALVPSLLPAEHRVVISSLHGELSRIVGDTSECRLLLDRRLLRGRPRLGWDLRRWRRDGVDVRVVVAR